ncbi:hypothetical protein HPG69_007994 [Diceros bicornis minor]|uniref:Alpha/beta hydrolase fold-3 domain-containing protein n=1 Tax=Diceros bicornis minor TaxID=77932 RepID=A0A7J7EFW2_DICBM|nr:hypothetical protein HPG69_007994 [Diceros bicornis minor]
MDHPSSPLPIPLPTPQSTAESPAGPSGISVKTLRYGSEGPGLFHFGDSDVFLKISIILYRELIQAIWRVAQCHLQTEQEPNEFSLLVQLKCVTATCFENIGIMRYEEFLSMIFRLDYTQLLSDEYNTVTDTALSDIPLQTSSSTPFSCSVEDSFAAVKIFLQDTVLTKYEVDPTRIRISGDSCGGTLAAAVTQQAIIMFFQVQNDLEIKHKIKIQALLYPTLQVIDSYLPSHRENEHGIILTRNVAVKLVSLYLTKDETFPQAMTRNQYMPLESRHLFKFVNWSNLLPEKYRKDHVHMEQVLGKSSYSLSALMDMRASPLLANDSQLRNLPSTCILTCQYDLMRDDGLTYVSRLQNAGVQVAHDHIEDGIHGALSFMTSPLYLCLGLRIRDWYIGWLGKNL